MHRSLCVVGPILIALMPVGPALAQSSINGLPLSVDDMQRVDQRCAELVNAGPTLGAAPSFNTSDREADEAFTDRNRGLANQVDGAVNRIDLRSITLEACFDAGFLDDPLLND
jgi:hypothetical protein